MKTNDPHLSPSVTASLPGPIAGSPSNWGSPFSRRSLLVSMIAAPAMALVVAACGDPNGAPAATTPDTGPDNTGGGSSVPPATDAPSSIQHPTAATDAVIRLGYEGGFVTQGTAFVNMPTLLISGDGMAYTPGVTTMQFPGPLLLPMGVRTITEAATQKLLGAAQSAGLLAPPPDYVVDSNVADAPNTVVRLQAGGSTSVHSAYALGFGTDAQGQTAPETTPARLALQGFVTMLGDLVAAVGADQLGDETVFVPTEYRVQATPVVEADLAGIDPAPTIIDWPATTGLALATAAACARLTAQAAGTVLADADSNTYFRQDEVLYRVVAAPTLPGDAVC